MIIIPGAFNPITNAHVQLGIEIRKRYPQESIVYIPSSHDYICKYKKYEKEDIIGIDERLCLIHRALSEYDFSVSEIEISGCLSGYAIDTLDYYKKKLNEDIYYVIGMDQLQNLVNWHEGKRLINENKFIVMDRKGYNNIGFSTCVNMMANPDNFTFIHADIPMISSSLVRHYVKEGMLFKIKDLVPECVYEFYKYNNKQV